MIEEIEDLLEILDYYIYLAHCDFFSFDMKDQIEILEKDIANLREFVSNPNNISSFNFNNLKKNLNELFSPDTFSPPKEFLKNPQETLSDTLDIVDMITFHIAKDPSFSINPLGEIKEIRGPKHAKKEEKNKLGSKITDMALVTLFLASERFNYIFKGVPSNAKEYFHLLDKYDRGIQKLTAQIDFYDSSIAVLERQLLLLKTERLNITRDEYVEDIYYERHDRAQIEADRDKDALDSFDEQRIRREAELSPLIYQEFANWQNERQFYIQQYESLYNAYMYQSQTMQNQQFLESRKRLDNMARYINENYSDINRGYAIVRDKVLSSDARYQQITRNVATAKDKFQTSNSKVAQLEVNMPVILESIRKDIEEDYSKKIDDTTAALDRKKKIRRKKQDKLDALHQKREELVENHQREFDVDNYFKRQRQ
ncbi:MAG: hypothetical protein J6A52_04855 [Bacilli bacterium]|nr:hypothetical protein [Bacilli bacterium]